MPGENPFEDKLLGGDELEETSTPLAHTDLIVRKRAASFLIFNFAHLTREDFTNGSVMSNSDS